MKLIEDVYDFLTGAGEIHQSKLREIVPSPSNRHILEIIKLIQEKPYLFVKKDGRYTYLELDDQPRREQSSILKLGETVDKFGKRREKLKKMELQSSLSTFFLLNEYKKMSEDLYEELRKLIEYNK